MKTTTQSFSNRSKAFLTILAISSFASIASAGFDIGDIGGAIGGDLGGVIGDLTKKKIQTVSVPNKASSPEACESEALRLAESQAVAKCTEVYGKSCALKASTISRKAVQGGLERGPYTGYGRGDSNDRGQAESNALVSAKQNALAECQRLSGSPCVMFTEAYITSPASENPAVTVGGLSGGKFTAKAQASAKPTTALASTFDCEATATAKVKK